MGVYSCRKGIRLWTSQNRSGQANEKENLSSKLTLSWAGGWTFKALSQPKWLWLIHYDSIFHPVMGKWLLVPSKIHHRFLGWIPEKGGLWHYSACVSLSSRHIWPVPSPLPFKTVGNKTPQWYIAMSFGKNGRQGKESAVCELSWESSTRCQQIHRNEQCYECLNLRRD